MRVLICGLLNVPNGDAGAVRQHTLAIMCRALEHEAMIVGLGQSNEMRPQNFQGISVVSLREGGSNTRDKIASHLRYWRRLKQVLRAFCPDVVIMDDMGTLKTMRIMRYCKSERIHLIHDSVEWYSPEQFRHGRFSMAYLKKDMLNRYLINRNCDVIAISQYLFRHFQNKGCRCVRIPIVVSEKDLCSAKHLQKNKVVFTYAGQPGKKDYLHIMLAAFEQLSPEALSRVQFHIVGCNRQQMLDAGLSEEILDKLQSCLVIHGRISRNEVLDILKETDFTILMRSPQQRYAKAGFPTKVVESLSRSTPVICNLTSDLEMYLTDSVDSLLVRDCSAESLKECLEKAIDLSAEEREAMCKSSLGTVKKHFLCDIYQNQLKMLLEKNTAK